MKIHSGNKECFVEPGNSHKFATYNLSPQFLNLL